tara:strand:+ start:2753 stop:3598 length:846 start_codon:yes stop_codon:yes gene_type:complete
MKASLILLLLATPFLTSAGGPWLTKKGSGFLQLQTTLPTGSFNRLFLENNKELTLNRSILDYTYQVYIEYGLTDKLNIISSLPFKQISTGSIGSQTVNTKILPKGNLSGIGNYKLALKYSLSNKKLKAAISIQSSLKTISRKIESGLITGYDANSFGPFLSIGRSFSPKLYSYIETGINFYSNDFSNTIDLHYELGYQLNSSLWAVLTFDMRESLKNGSYRNENLRQTGFYTNNQEFVSPGLKMNYELKNELGFSVATYAGLSGNYVGKIGMFSLGIYKKW